MCEIGFKQDKNKLSLDIILLKTIILIFNQIENARLSLKLLLLEKNSYLSSVYFFVLLKAKKNKADICCSKAPSLYHKIKINEYARGTN